MTRDPGESRPYQPHPAPALMSQVADLPAFVHEDGTACVAGYDGTSLECAEGHGLVLRADSYSRLRQMSSQTRTLEEQATATRCPTCLAPPGVECDRTDGLRWHAHASRVLSMSRDWERIAREAVQHVIRHREDFHNASARPCPTCDKSAAFLDGLPREVVRAYVDSSCTSEQRTRGGRQ